MWKMVKLPRFSSFSSDRWQPGASVSCSAVATEMLNPAAVVSLSVLNERSKKLSVDVVARSALSLKVPQIRPTELVEFVLLYEPATDVKHLQLNHLPLLYVYMCTYTSYMLYVYCLAIIKKYILVSYCNMFRAYLSRSPQNFRYRLKS